VLGLALDVFHLERRIVRQKELRSFKGWERSKIFIVPPLKRS